MGMKVLGLSLWFWPTVVAAFALIISGIVATLRSVRAGDILVAAVGAFACATAATYHTVNGVWTNVPVNHQLRTGLVVVALFAMAWALISCFVRPPLTQEQGGLH